VGRKAGYVIELDRLEAMGIGIDHAEVFCHDFPRNSLSTG